jgi:hypothetical protein
MAPDERDRMFDKALARHLRSATPAGEVAGTPGVSASQKDACPDPETLAAYHERSLLPEQLNSLKEHIVGCAECQTVLAHLETTDEIPLQAAEEEQVLAVKESEPEMAARKLEAIPATASASPKKSRRVLLLRGARWQWLAPAGAIAAGLLVWIALHENRPLVPSNVPEGENKVAQNRAPATPLPSDVIAVPQPSAPPKPTLTLKRQQSSAGEPALSNGRLASQATKQVQGLSAGTGTRSEKSKDDKEFSVSMDRERDASTDRLAAASRADLDEKNLPEALRKKEEAASQAANLRAEAVQSQNSQTQNQSNNYAQQRVAGPNPSAAAQSPKKARAMAAPAAAPSAPPPQPGVGGEVASSYSDSASLELTRGISNPRLISPPASNSVWRAGRSGLIEFSKDGGSSWSRQTSGVLVDLLTGSSPSDQVCWIVGRVGAVLLTTDGGAHWKIVPSPLAEDLGGIRASDALHATIWNSGSTKSFETTDGGLTWKPVPNP